MRCARCNGRMEHTGDRWGAFWACINCGAEVQDEPTAEDQPRGSPTSCVECGKSDMHAKGLCRTCYQRGWDRRKRDPSHKGVRL